MSGHTPGFTQGPWTVTMDPAKRHTVVRLGGWAVVAEVRTSPGTIDADARLIAAAPDLLEALKAVMNNVYGDDDAPEEVDAKAKAIAAIAKAEGK